VTRDGIRKGVRVIFRGPGDGVAPLYDAESHKLVGCIGTVVYGVSEDVWCYPEGSAADLVWVAFDADKLTRRQVSVAWLDVV
jgi:hypothetical protein